MAQIDTGCGAGRADRRVGRQGHRRRQAGGEGNDLALKLDYATKEAGAYPIVLVTYEIVCSKYKDAERRPTSRPSSPLRLGRAPSRASRRSATLRCPPRCAAKVDAAIAALS